jgi:hypothetical protein
MAGPRSHLFGHRWFEASGDWTPPYGGTPVTLFCDTCGMERRDAFGERTGELVYRRYLDHNGYRRTKDEPKVTTAELRLAWVKAHVAEARQARRNGGNGKKKAAS